MAYSEEFCACGHPKSAHILNLHEDFEGTEICYGEGCDIMAMTRTLGMEIKRCKCRGFKLSSLS